MKAAAASQPVRAPSPAAAAVQPVEEDGFSKRNPTARQQHVSLDIRQLGKKRLGLPYMSLGPVLWEPPQPLVLDYPAFNLSVIIDGRNLEPLYLAVLAHQARYIQQADELAAARAGEDATVITSIEVRRVEKP